MRSKRKRKGIVIIQTQKNIRKNRKKLKKEKHNPRIRNQKERRSVRKTGYIRKILSKEIRQITKKQKTPRKVDQQE